MDDNIQGILGNKQLVSFFRRLRDKEGVPPLSAATRVFEEWLKQNGIYHLGDIFPIPDDVNSIVEFFEKERHKFVVELRDQLISKCKNRHPVLF